MRRVSCNLANNSAETTCTTSPEQIEVMKLEGYSGQSLMATRKRVYFAVRCCTLYRFCTCAIYLFFFCVC